MANEIWRSIEGSRNVRREGHVRKKRESAKWKVDGEDEAISEVLLWRR